RLILLFYSSCSPLSLHSFPTRRSSDLEARRPDGGGARRSRLAGGLRISRRPSRELRRDERRPRPCRAGWSRHDRPSRVGCRGTATLYTTGGGRLTIAL